VAVRVSAGCDGVGREVLATAAAAPVRCDREVRSERRDSRASTRRLRLQGADRQVTIARAALALVVASAVRTAAAEPCAPRAALDGDAEAIARVGEELRRLGVAVELRGAAGREGRCGAIIAAVELDRGGGIAVSVSDASHRSEGRVVSDAAVAAAWID